MVQYVALDHEIAPIDEVKSLNLKNPSSKLTALCQLNNINETETVALDSTEEPFDTVQFENIEVSTDESDDENSDEKFTRVMACQWRKGKGPMLPKMFKLTNPQPGEPPFMKMRDHPAVLRFHKFKLEKDPEAYWFSEALLYMPHDNEDDLVNKIDQAKSGGEEAWQKFVDKIKYVKSQVMEYIEDNEEARMMAAEMFIDDNLTGEYMDPEGEQEAEDNLPANFDMQEEFEHLDPDVLEL
jgi:hypothetical protein